MLSQTRRPIRRSRRLLLVRVKSFRKIWQTLTIIYVCGRPSPTLTIPEETGVTRSRIREQERERERRSHVSRRLNEPCFRGFYRPAILALMETSQRHKTL